MNILLIALGGALGSVLRYLISLTTNSLFQNIFQGNKFPYGTLVVNIFGSFSIGLLLGYSLSDDNISKNIVPFFVTGVLGGFTTFSTFSFETITLFQQGEYLTALTYIILSVLLSLLLTLVGVKLFV